MEKENACRRCSEDPCIKKVPLFASLDEESLASLSSQMIQRRYAKGESLVKQGDYPLGFTVIGEGSAKAFRLTPDGREQILYIFPQHDYFGARFLFTEERVPYSVEALEECSVCILSKQQFSRLLASHVSIAMQIIAALAKRMRRLETILQSMGGRNAELRIASLLLEFKEVYGQAGPEGVDITLPLSREGLANYLGLARETLSRKLTQLEEAGLIQNLDSRHVRLLDVPALADLSVQAN